MSGWLLESVILDLLQPQGFQHTCSVMIQDGKKAKHGWCEWGRSSPSTLLLPHGWARRTLSCLTFPRQGQESSVPGAAATEEFEFELSSVLGHGRC